MAAFLRRLAAAGIQPAEVITDGAALYPRVLADIWPQAAHQLCLFHETRHLTRAVQEVISQVQRTFPVPEVPPTFAWGPAPVEPDGDAVPAPVDHDLVRWQIRQAARTAGVAQVPPLAQQGLSQHAIARQLGLNRRTVKRWLTEGPPLSASGEAQAADAYGPTSPRRRPRPTLAVLTQMADLVAQGWSSAAIAVHLGLHRGTVAQWLTLRDTTGAGTGTTDGAPIPHATTPQAPDPAAPVAAGLPAPPAPWTGWDQVAQVREALHDHRFLFVHRPTHLRPEEQAQLDALLASPVGPALSVARDFLREWWAIWHDEHGHKRSWDEAARCYQAWHDAVRYAAVAPLARRQARLTADRFRTLSQFLRHPPWEATNNGAQRAGRAFRHGQAPHFTLRTAAALDGEVRVAARQRMERACRTQPLVAVCRRGHHYRCSAPTAAAPTATLSQAS